MEFNYYEILGVSKNASEDEIKTAFKSLAKKYHPDKHAGNTVYEEHFKKINSAYQTLSDPKKRQRYDYILFHRSQPRPAQQRKQPTQQTSQRPMYKNAHPKQSYPKKFQYAAFTILGFTIFFTGAIFFYHYMNDITAQDHFEQGVLMESANRNLEAMQQYTAAISYNEKMTEAFVRRANLRFKIMSDYKGALNDYTRALKQEKKSNLYFSRAKCYLKMKKYNEGLSDLNKALVLNPKSDTLYYYKGEVYNYILKKYSSAIEEYNNALFLNKNFTEAILGRALSKQSLMQHQEAVEDYNILIQKNPNEGSYYYYRGYSKVFLKQKNEACLDFMQAYSLRFEEAQNMIKEYCK